jgi:hypothetical protein
MSRFADILAFLGLLENAPDGEIEPLVALPVINIKVVDAITLTDIDQGTTFTLDALVTQAAAPQTAALESLRAVGPDLVFGWAFVSVTIDDINAVIAAAREQDPSYEPPNFSHYFEVVCPHGFDTGPLVNALNAWTDVIEYAYEAPVASDPANARIVGITNPLLSRQGYLSAAPVGINAPAAWGKGAGGDGLLVIDIEQGWFLGHEDLPQNITLLGGINPMSASWWHGAAVLGELVAIDNNVGIVGIAPNAFAEVLSYNDRPPPRTPPTKAALGATVQRLMDRIINAAKALPFGNVMLIEAQLPVYINDTKFNAPPETDPWVFVAIQAATKKGVIVIEAAGNSPNGADLDTFVNDKPDLKDCKLKFNGMRTLSRNAPFEFLDSGAIIVGASLAAFPHARWPHSGFGSRIDCYAWGEQIVTCGWDGFKPEWTLNNLYFGVNTLVAFDFEESDLLDLPTLISELQLPKRPVDTWLSGQLSSDTKAAFASYTGQSSAPAKPLVDDLNRIIAGPLIYNANVFTGVVLSSDTHRLLPLKPGGQDGARLNRLLLGDAYPSELASGNAFGGTSGAAPIIAGCCLLVQSLRGILTPNSGIGNLGPFQMRRLLTDPSNGTASAQPTEEIGIMPDLQKIITNEFQP